MSDKEPIQMQDQDQTQQQVEKPDEVFVDHVLIGKEAIILECFHHWSKKRDKIQKSEVKKKAILKKRQDSKEKSGLSSAWARLSRVLSRDGSTDEEEEEEAPAPPPAGEEWKNIQMLLREAKDAERAKAERARRREPKTKLEELTLAETARAHRLDRVMGVLTQALLMSKGVEDWYLTHCNHIDEKAKKEIKEVVDECEEQLDCIRDIFPRIKLMLQENRRFHLKRTRRRVVLSSDSDSSDDEATRLVFRGGNGPLTKVDEVVLEESTVPSHGKVDLEYALILFIIQKICDWRSFMARDSRLEMEIHRLRDVTDFMLTEMMKAALCLDKYKLNCNIKSGDTEIPFTKAIVTGVRLNLPNRYMQLDGKD